MIIIICVILILNCLGNPDRRKIIDSIRKKGTFEYNTNSVYNHGNLIVSRRPSCPEKKDISYYRVCPNCKGHYSKFAIRKHYSKCIPKHVKGDRSVNIMGKLISGQIHFKASETLRTVFSLLREDDVTKVIRYDELIIIYGNTLCQKYRLPHYHKMIRARLRLIGRFLLEIKKIDNCIHEYSSVFKPENFESALEAVNILGGLNAAKQEYSSPSTATEMGLALKKCCKMLITLCIKRRNDELKVDAKDFFRLLEEDLPIYVNKPALETRLQQIRRKKIALPSTQDIHKFNSYIEKNLDKYLLKLQGKFSFVIWKELASYTLTMVQLFNRKRAGEIERITVEDFQAYQQIDLNEIGKLLKTSETYVNSKQYVRFLIRGKKARGVPVLLCDRMLKSIKMILQHRKQAGVPEKNPYVFGIPGNSLIFCHLSSCILMRRFSKESGVSNPELLRGTQLRKHIATQSALMNINEGERSDLANFLGHADKIHREHYQIPIAAREIGRISQLLEIGIGKNPCKNMSFFKKAHI